MVKLWGIRIFVSRSINVLKKSFLFLQNLFWTRYFHTTVINQRCIPTTHICVENTVLASTNCFLFKLSYNVMIMCEMHQLMYIAIIPPSKRTTPPDFRCISPFVWQQSPKCQFFGQITTPKITLIYRQFLIQIICSKMKSLHLQQTSRSDLGI